MDALWLALGTLTRWRVPPPRTVDRRTARGAMLLAPWVGAVLGAGAGALAWLAGWIGLSALATAPLVIAALALTSRGLHLDGLADTADGLGSGREADRALEIMRDSAVGPVGAATLMLTLLVQVTALSQVLTWSGPVGLAVAVMASRLALTVACSDGVPAARPGGLGAAVAGSVPGPLAALDLLLVAGVAAVAFVLTGQDGFGSCVAAVVMVALVAAVTSGLLRTARRRLGGITGDVLGAAVELSLAAVLIPLAVLPT